MKALLLLTFLTLSSTIWAAPCSEKILAITNQSIMYRAGFDPQNKIPQDIVSIVPATRVLMKVGIILKSNSHYLSANSLNQTIINQQMEEKKIGDIVHQADFAAVSGLLKSEFNYIRPDQSYFWHITPTDLTTDPWLEVLKAVSKNYGEYFRRYIDLKKVESVWLDVLKEKDGLNLKEISTTLELINNTPSFCEKKYLATLSTQELANAVLRTYFQKKLWKIKD